MEVQTDLAIYQLYGSEQETGKLWACLRECDAKVYSICRWLDLFCFNQQSFWNWSLANELAANKLLIGNSSKYC